MHKNIFAKRGMHRYLKNGQAPVWELGSKRQFSVGMSIV